MIRNESQYDATKEYYVQLLLIHSKMKDDNRMPTMASVTLWRSVRYLREEIDLWELKTNHVKQLYEDDDDPDIRA